MIGSTSSPKHTKIIIAGVFVVAWLVRITVWYLDAQHAPSCLDQYSHRLELRILSVAAVQNAARPAVKMDAIVGQVASPCADLVDARLRLHWYQPLVQPQPGDLITAVVKLRVPWGQSNPGGFDYGNWLLAQGYRATGYIQALIAHQANLPPQTAWFEVPPELVHDALLAAMVIGQRERVAPAAWQLFRETGTVHLMVVSGLHVGILFGASFGLLQGLFRCWPQRRQGGLPGRFLALGLSAGLLPLYAVLTGANPPVVRASTMALLLIALYLVMHKPATWRVLLVVGLGAVMIAPQILWQQGFWLSYLAVAVLLYFFSPRWPRTSWLMALCQCQAVIGLAMSPLLGFTVGQIPLVSPLTNLLVVPIVSLITVPFALLGLLLKDALQLDDVAMLLLRLADFSLHVALLVLEEFAGVLTEVGPLGLGKTILVAVSGLIMLTPVRRRQRLLACCGWITLFTPPQHGLLDGQFRVQILDVGQGNAAIVDTAHKRWVIDTGVAHRSGFSMAQAVLIPALRASGNHRIDRLVVSHHDLDHAGGVPKLAATYPGLKITGWSSPCDHGRRWVHDGVTFYLLTDITAVAANDRSCVLVVSNGQATVVFAGDISQRAERRLMAMLPANVDLLVAPHHGSATSSSAAFVRKLNAHTVVFSTARNNRYGHPRAEVVARYRRTGARLLTTWRSGAIIWHSTMPDSVARHRCLPFSRIVVDECRQQ